MEAPFKCQCGKTVREEVPFRCETCPECGSVIVEEVKPFDEPLPHAIVERKDEFGVSFKQCKRCSVKS
jgi:hypothetical protein